jgi:hypothetical protein
MPLRSDEKPQTTDPHTKTHVDETGDARHPADRPRTSRQAVSMLLKKARISRSQAGRMRGRRAH